MNTGRPIQRGFTLIEVVIVVGLLGILMAVLAATFSVIIETRQPTEARIDDARTTLGLASYLSSDVSSTPADGFHRAASRGDADDEPTGCAGGSTVGFSLVRLTWSEVVTTTNTYTVNYRLVPEADSSRIVRFSCVDGGPATALSVTGALPQVTATWEPGDPPADVSLPDPTSVRMEVTASGGNVTSLEAHSNNRGADLPPPTILSFPTDPPPSNHDPVELPIDPRIAPVGPATIALDVTDPDVGDALAVAAAVTATDLGWTAAVAGQTITVTPPVGAVLNDHGTVLYTVSDGRGGSLASSVTVTVDPAPINTPPTARNVNATVVAGTPLLLNLPVHDVNGDPLSITFTPPPPSWVTVSVDPGTRIMTVRSDGGGPAFASFGYTVTDGRGGTDSASVALDITRCAVSSLTPSATSTALSNGADRLMSDVVFTVNSTGPCNDLVLVFNHDGDDDTPPDVVSFAGRDSVTIKGPFGLSNWSTGSHEFSIRNGITGSELLTTDLTTI